MQPKKTSNVQITGRKASGSRMNTQQHQQQSQPQNQNNNNVNSIK
jgi:hypothetical protein